MGVKRERKKNIQKGKICEADAKPTSTTKKKGSDIDRTGKKGGRPIIKKLKVVLSPVLKQGARVLIKEVWLSSLLWREKGRERRKTHLGGRGG